MVSRKGEKPRIPHDAVVLIGDGRKAMVLRNRGEPDLPNLVVEDLMEQENPKTSEQGADEPGRHIDTPAAVTGGGQGGHRLGGDQGTHPRGGPRSAMEQTDWHQLAEDRFAVEVADSLYKAAHACRFDRLVVVAPPKALAVLRKAWRKEVAAVIVAEIAADLTHLPMAELDRYFTPG